MNRWQDEKGWTLRDKARMVAGYWTFFAWDKAWSVLWVLSRRRIHIMNHRWAWDFLLTMAGWGYLYDDWRKGDMPEHVSKGGVWR